MKGEDVLPQYHSKSILTPRIIYYLLRIICGLYLMEQQR